MMVYLIDDKKLRQENDYQWSENRFHKYNQIIQPIYTLKELQNRSEEIFSEGNIILYHESFLNKTSLSEQDSKRKDKLIAFQKKTNSYLVFFGGSINSITLNEKIAYIPVSTLYQNLEVFIKKLSNNNFNIKHLLFGKKPEIEERLSNDLQEKLKTALREEIIDIEGNNIFIRPLNNYISNPINGVLTKTLLNDVSDDNLSKKIIEWLDKEKYDNIFLPLCFGSTLSDYNGLRLALHIRCTKTINQTTSIFIYGFVKAEELLENRYFDILKTKGVKLIGFSKKDMKVAVKENLETLTDQELSTEMSKLKLDPPKSYYDNHSIANEWGVYQMARNADINLSNIESFDEKKINSLFFKWLRTKNNLDRELDVEQKTEQREYTKRLQGIKTIGKIDLSKL